MARLQKRREIKARHWIAFPAFELFPPADILGQDLLCLMSAYNDILRVVEWMQAYQHKPKDRLARKIDDQRRSMQWRLLLGLLHETSKSLKRMTSDQNRFRELFSYLDNDGRAAYEALKEFLSWNSSDAPKPLDAFLFRVRNQGAFHYIRSHFGEGLKQLKESFGSVDDGFILEGTPAQGRIRFSFADTARNAAAFGANQDVNRINLELGKHLEEVLELMAQFNHFLQTAFFSYCRLRGFEPSEDHDNFRINRT